MGALNLRTCPDPLHDALRVEAAKRKTSIKAVVIEAITEWLQRAGAGPQKGAGG